MTILHINDKIENSGGVETYLKQLCELAPAHQIEIHWVGIYKANKAYSLKKYPYYTKTENTITLTDTILYIKKLIKQHPIDIIHVHSISDPALLKELFLLKPVVRSMHEPRLFCLGQGKFWRFSEKTCTHPFGFHCLYHAYTEGCCDRHPKRLIPAYQNTLFETSVGNQNYRAIIAMSDYIKKEAVIAGYDKAKIYVNPYFTPLVAPDSLVKTSNTNKKSILFTGRLSIVKGLHYLIDAFLSLHEKFPDSIKLDVVGNGVDMTRYYEQVKQLPQLARNNITFHGWQDRKNIHNFLINTDIVAFPSIYPEAFGIVGIEAMMYGKPVVGFDVGGVSTWLKDKQTGFLVEPKNSDELAAKIILLLENDEMYTSMSIEARKVALEKFSPDIHMKKLTEIYNLAIKN